MSDENGELKLEWTPASDQKVTVTVYRCGRVVHIDTINPTISVSRNRFVKRLIEKVPQADAAVVETELVRIAGDNAAQSQSVPWANCEEVEVSRIVRPELIITPDVTAITVPIIRGVGGTATPTWVQHLRWGDGKRERRELSNRIEVPNGSTLWVSPIPGDPSMTLGPTWSGTSRRSWLAGAPSPDPADVFRRICVRIAHYIELQPDVAAGTTATLALWCILSYCFQAWNAVPYLYVGGPMSSGKSTLLAILHLIVFRGLQASNITAPTLFRTLNDRGGVLLFDEAERLRQSTPEVTEILSMLLAGYKRGGQAIRLEPIGDAYRPVVFDVFGPKVLACIAGLPPALSSRCISVMMFRAPPDSPKPMRRVDAAADEWRSLRDDLHVLALEYGRDILEVSKKQHVCPDGINGRAYELWQPILALASWIETHGAEGLLELVQQYALHTIRENKDEHIPDADETLLEILAEQALSGGRPTPGELLVTARERDPATFGKPNGNGPSWQANTVTRRLKTYGIPKPPKSNGERRYRDVLVQLRQIQRSYGLDLGIPDSVSNMSPHNEASNVEHF